MTQEHVAEYTPWTRYLFTWIALLALSLLALALSYVHMGGGAEMAIQLVLATAKTLLLMLVFMHLLEQKPINAIIPAVAFGLAVLLLSLTTVDVLTRHTFPRAPLPQISPEPPRTIPPPPGGTAGPPPEPLPSSARGGT